MFINDIFGFRCPFIWWIVPVWLDESSRTMWRRQKSGDIKMTVQRVFMTGDNMAAFGCPKCQKIRNRDVSQYKGIDRAVRMKCKCPCGCAYSVLLERRAFYRKETHLPGVYFRSKDYRKPMTVKDLSINGLKFEVRGKHDLTAGDRLFVEFPLDDEQRTLIRKPAIVKKIAGAIIGAEFYSEGYGKNLPDKAIGFYVRPSSRDWAWRPERSDSLTWIWSRNVRQFSAFHPPNENHKALNINGSDAFCGSGNITADRVSYFGTKIRQRHEYHGFIQTLPTGIARFR